jgi:hypothetical protein
LVVAEVRERLALSKRAAQNTDVETLSLEKLKQGDVKEEYLVTIRNKLASLESLEDSGDINAAWDNIRQNIKFLPGRVQVVVNQSTVNRGLMSNVQNW